MFGLNEVASKIGLLSQDGFRKGQVVRIDRGFRGSVP